MVRNKKSLNWWTKNRTEAETNLIESKNEHENDPHNTDSRGPYGNFSERDLIIIVYKFSGPIWTKESILSGLELIRLSFGGKIARNRFFAQKYVKMWGFCF